MATTSSSAQSDASSARLALNYTLWVHGESFSKENVLFNASVLPEKTFKEGSLLSICPVRRTGKTAGSGKDLSVKYQLDNHESENSKKNAAVSATGIESHSEIHHRTQRFLFVARDMSPDQKMKHPQLHISVSEDIARLFGLESRSTVLVSEEAAAECGASHVEIYFRDVYLARGDMWRMICSELNDTACFEGQKLLFLGTIKAMVKRIYNSNMRVASAKVSGSSRIIFRSESARFVIYIQLSKEMWEFDDASGDIMFNKVIYGFLPELFRRWSDLKVRHLVTIVLFTRVQHGSPQHESDAIHKEQLAPWTTSRDFYRVVTSDMASGDWAAILTKLKQDFKVFLRDVSTHRAETMSAKSGQESHSHQQSHHLEDATNGNILEAINLASAHFERDHLDRDLARTGLSIIVITPGTGVFDVDESLLHLTTERLINNGIGIDLVCLSRKPLHSVPLFKYSMRAKVSVSESDDRLYADMQTALPSSSLRKLDDQATFTNRQLQSRALPKGMQTPIDEGGSGQLRFAMPHWVNVSFWAADIRSSSALISSAAHGNGQAVTFTPHCRMYELQMMGYMENEASNISIPFLNQHIRQIQHRKHQEFSTPRKNGLKNSFESKSSLRNSARSPHYQQSGNVWTHKQDANSDDDVSSKMDLYDSDVFAVKSAQQHEVSKEDVIGEDIVKGDEKSRSSSLGPLKHGELKSKISSLTVDSTTLPKGAAELEHPNTVSPKVARVEKQKDPTKRGLLSLSLAYQKRTSSVSAPSVTEPVVSGMTYKSPINKTSSTTQLNGDSVANKVRWSLSRTTTGLSTVTAESSKPIMIQDIDTRSIVSTTKPLPEDPDATANGQEPKANVAGVLSKAALPRHAPPRAPAGRNAEDRQRLTASFEITSPWLTLLNPSNPQPSLRQRAFDYNRWQHVFPSGGHATAMKWSSLCTPASLPLTNGFFPTSEQLQNNYTESPYKIALAIEDDDEETAKNRQRLVRELVDFRLSRGFQMVSSKGSDSITPSSDGTNEKMYTSRFMADIGDVVHLSKGNTIHQIVCGATSEIQITLYRKLASVDHALVALSTQLYEPMVRALTADKYTSRTVKFAFQEDDFNWNYVDHLLAGYQMGDMERLRSWRSRFVLLPMETRESSRRGFPTLPEDTEEETRIEGLRKLTQMWQRFRYIPIEERRYHAALNLKKDPNPLKIEFQTRDPSLVVALGFDNSLLAETEATAAPTNLFAPESDLYRTNSFDLHRLASDIQGEKGIRIQNRKWHWKLHIASFVGAELTTWLLANFTDVDSREQAVDLGNMLMDKGLFQHVHRKHRFRDGHFLFTFTDDYRAARPESRMSWFGTSRRQDKPFSITPSSEAVRELGSPDWRRKNEAMGDVASADSSKRPTVSLSSKIVYDVDHRKRSDRAELIDLHYDRLHNPGNAFHIQVVWSTATGGLIEDSVAHWSMLAEKHGLRLVQVPIFEASSLSFVHPFREPHPIRLALLPPGFDPAEGNVIKSPPYSHADDRYLYHKEILKKFNYVLDVEAATNFPADVDVTFSWGRPDYKASQYIHKTGLLLMQIAADGRFLLVANRLCNNRILARDNARFEKAEASDKRGIHQPRDGAKFSPVVSPVVRAVQDSSPVPPLFLTNEALPTNGYQLKDDFEEFCASKERLQAFYDEIFKLEERGPETPSIMPTDALIPRIGLPPPVEGLNQPVTREATAAMVNISEVMSMDPKSEFDEADTTTGEQP